MSIHRRSPRTVTAIGSMPPGHSALRSPGVLRSRCRDHRHLGQWLRCVVPGASREISTPQCPHWNERRKDKSADPSGRYVESGRTFLASSRVPGARCGGARPAPPNQRRPPGVNPIGRAAPAAGSGDSAGAGTFRVVTDLDTVTVAELRAALDSGDTTSRALVEAHLDRVARLDPAFGSVRCLAPDAAEQAGRSDRIRRDSGPRGPLEGIPVLVKDNIDVAGLPTTGGALALEHAMPARDAPLVARLREAGAVVLGKTNLSELANFLTEDMPSGYSSLGGQVLNPYDLSRTPSGSSSGSGAAAALGLATVTVGTETDGSIISPSNAQSLVGLKPTLGLVPGDGVLPISTSQDCAG